MQIKKGESRAKSLFEKWKFIFQIGSWLAFILDWLQTKKVKYLFYSMIMLAACLNFKTSANAEDFLSFPLEKVKSNPCHNVLNIS